MSIETKPARADTKTIINKSDSNILQDNSCFDKTGDGEALGAGHNLCVYTLRTTAASIVCKNRNSKRVLK